MSAHFDQRRHNAVVVGSRGALPYTRPMTIRELPKLVLWMAIILGVVAVFGFGAAAVVALF